MYIIQARYKMHKKDLIIFWGLRMSHFVKKTVNLKDMKDFLYQNAFLTENLALKRLESIPERLFIENEDFILISKEIKSVNNLTKNIKI